MNKEERINVRRNRLQFRIKMSLLQFSIVVLNSWLVWKLFLVCYSSHLNCTLSAHERMMSCNTNYACKFNITSKCPTILPYFSSFEYMLKFADFIGCHLLLPNQTK